MNLVLHLKLLSITIYYHIKEVCEIESVDYLIEDLTDESIYTIIEHLFESWQKVSEISIENFFQNISQNYLDNLISALKLAIELRMIDYNNYYSNFHVREKLDSEF